MAWTPKPQKTEDLALLSRPLDGARETNCSNTENAVHPRESYDMNVTKNSISADRLLRLRMPLTKALEPFQAGKHE